jgi:hypothetical protein
VTSSPLATVASVGPNAAPMSATGIRAPRSRARATTSRGPAPAVIAQAVKVYSPPVIISARYVARATVPTVARVSSL